MAHSNPLLNFVGTPATSIDNDIVKEAKEVFEQLPVNVAINMKDHMFATMIIASIKDTAKKTGKFSRDLFYEESVYASIQTLVDKAYASDKLKEVYDEKVNWMMHHQHDKRRKIHKHFLKGILHDPVIMEGITQDAGKSVLQSLLDLKAEKKNLIENYLPTTAYPALSDYLYDLCASEMEEIGL